MRSTFDEQQRRLEAAAVQLKQVGGNQPGRVGSRKLALPVCRAVLVWGWDETQHGMCEMGSCFLHVRLLQAAESAAAEASRLAAEPSPLVAARARLAERQSDAMKFAQLIENLQVHGVWITLCQPQEKTDGRPVKSNTMHGCLLLSVMGHGAST
jgi:hypothetical protein